MNTDIDSIIEHAITGLASDDVRDGVDQIYELAILYKTAGLKAEDFVSMCNYIESEAIYISDKDFVKEKISIALKKVREQKHGIIVKLH